MSRNWSMKPPNSSVPECVAEGAEIVLFGLGGARSGEKVCIVSDRGTRRLGEIFFSLAKERGLDAVHYPIEPLKMHGEEPPSAVAEAMVRSALVLGLTERSMAHTEARQAACLRGVRYLSLPEYSEELLAHDSLRADFKGAAAWAKPLAEELSNAGEVRVLTERGTDIVLDISGRKSNLCPGFVSDDFPLGSPPDIEVNVSPVETASNGVLVVDGSIPYPGFGKLSSPVRLRVEKGCVTAVEGDGNYSRRLEELFSEYGAKARVLAELGIGLNEKAKLCGIMLVDEGCAGTVHFGFGANSTMGGLNRVNFHLDCVLYAGEVLINGKPRTLKITEEGR